MSLFEAFKQALKAVFKFDANNNLKTTIAGDEVNIAKDDTLSAIKAQTDKLQFDSKNYLKISPRTQIEVHDEVVEAGEVFYIPSGTEVAFNNLTINGKCIVSGKCVVLGELVIGENGELVLDDNGELVLMDV